MKAMILAAGRGERLRPLTDRIPKPLVEVGGVSLIERHIVSLKKAGITEIVINTAWLPEKLVEALGNGESLGVNIYWSHEIPGGLETAGGIKKALPLLGTDPFIVVNGDTLVDCDYASFAVHDLGDSYAHLWLTENPPHHPEGDFSIENGLVVNKPGFTFSGVAMYAPKAFEPVPEEKIPLRPWLSKWMEEGKVSGEMLNGAWFDAGTLQRIAAIEDYLAAKERK